MNNYRLLYAEQWKQVLVLILVPFIFIIPTLPFIVSSGLSDTWVVSLILLFIFAGIAFCIYLIFYQVNTIVHVTLKPDSIFITQEKKTWFNRFDAIEILLDNFKKITDDTDVQNGNRQFFRLQLKHPSKTIVLTALRKQPETEVQNFATALHANISIYNQSSNKMNANKIQEGSFYTSTFAKIFTWFCYAGIAGVTIALLCGSKDLPWWRAICFYSVAVSWIINYKAAKKRQLQKDNKSM